MIVGKGLLGDTFPDELVAGGVHHVDVQRASGVLADVRFVVRPHTTVTVEHRVADADARAQQSFNHCCRRAVCLSVWLSMVAVPSVRSVPSGTWKLKLA